MTRPSTALRTAGGVLLLGVVLSACAAPPTPQDTAAGFAPAAVRTTTAAANAPHPLTTLPGVRVGVQITALPTAVPTALPTLPAVRAPGTRLPVKAGPTPVAVTSVDGCNRAYGTANQCVPLLAPGGKPVNCAYLKSSGLMAKPLVVVRDPLGLLKKKNVRKGLSADGKYTTITGCTD